MFVCSAIWDGVDKEYQRFKRDGKERRRGLLNG